MNQFHVAGILDMNEAGERFDKPKGEKIVLEDARDIGEGG
jgi:hypothetical protein